MGVIWEVYDNLDTSVEFEEFEAAVSDKVEQMSDLADEEVAAMLIAHELHDERVNDIADIGPGMEDVKFLAEVVNIGEIRTFERGGEDKDGRVVNIEVADETGRIRISLWGKMATGAKGNLEVDTVLRIGGRPKGGYNGVEVSTSKVEEDLDAGVDMQVLDNYRVEDLALSLSDVNLEGKIFSTGTVRTPSRGDGTEGRVSNLSVGDPAGRIRVTLWDGRADLAEELEPGQSVEIVDGYVRGRDGSFELHVGSRGAVEPVDEDIEYVPETTDVDLLGLGQAVGITDGIIEANGGRIFDRGDGSEGQIRNIHVKGGTGDIRVALQGEKTDADVDLADYVIITDAEVREDWQEDLEASVDQRSSVAMVDEIPEGAVGTDAGGSAPTPPSDEGLNAFFDDRSSDGTSAANGESSSDVPAAESTDEAAKFTETVVQAGTPVILDDGTQTETIDTDADLGLGGEVTVSGTETDGRISAEPVEVHTDAQQQDGQTAGRRSPIAPPSAGRRT